MHDGVGSSGSGSVNPFCEQVCESREAGVHLGVAIVLRHKIRQAMGESWRWEGGCLCVTITHVPINYQCFPAIQCALIRTVGCLGTISACLWYSILDSMNFYTWYS